ncbi:MAG: hypothetical protein F6K24_30155 [Okeania sp. SIO2D1]|nr:hypothetical protein [Okeania sp. SIO2C9]NEQ75132.1 hypothetical protein [Okeania sp. SIO2C9]NES69189.1 hypothetical protein [Okeania sp. SIO2D1]
MAREQDAPTAVGRNKNNAMHHHYNPPPTLERKSFCEAPAKYFFHRDFAQ